MISGYLGNKQSYLSIRKLRVSGGRTARGHQTHVPRHARTSLNDIVTGLWTSAVKPETAVIGGHACTWVGMGQSLVSQLQVRLALNPYFVVELITWCCAGCNSTVKQISNKMHHVTRTEESDAQTFHLIQHTFYSCDWTHHMNLTFCCCSLRADGLDVSARLSYQQHVTGWSPTRPVSPSLVTRRALWAEGRSPERRAGY